MRFRSIVVLVAAASLSAGAALAQSLGELAAREEERKKREGGKQGKVYTESDLRGGGSGTVSQPAAVGVVQSPASAEGEAAQGGSAEGGAAGEGEPEKTEEELQAERSAQWRKDLEQAQAEVQRLQKRLDEIQVALNDLTQNLYGGTRAGLMNRLDQTRTELAAAQQKVADLEEQGRRNRYR